MANSGGEKTAARRPPASKMLPPELSDLYMPALKFGAGTGAVGGLGGAAFAILKDQPTVFTAGFHTLQFGLIGTTYWGSRIIYSRAFGGQENLTKGQMVGVSALSGSTAGIVLGTLRGPSHIMPSIVFWGLVGSVGQLVSRGYVDWKEAPAGQDDPEKSWLRWKYSPVKKLNDDEYLEVLRDRYLRFQAEIELIDEKVAEIRERQRAEAAGLDAVAKTSLEGKTEGTTSTR